MGDPVVLFSIQLDMKIDQSYILGCMLIRDKIFTACNVYHVVPRQMVFIRNNFKRSLTLRKISEENIQMNVKGKTIILESYIFGELP